MERTFISHTSHTNYHHSSNSVGVVRCLFFHVRRRRWGMTTRMVGGPVVVTKLKEDGQAKALGIEVGDVFVIVDGISIAQVSECLYQHQ